MGTYWGSELSGLRTGESVERPVEAAAQRVRDGDLHGALVALASALEADPPNATGYLELASAVRLLEQDDPRGAIVRLHFALGCDPPVVAIDALAERLAQHFRTASDTEWEALAWAQHREGHEHLRALVADQGLNPAWLSTAGLDTLEDLLFSLSDETGDPGWRALSALLASRASEPDDEPTKIVEMARPNPDENPRGWGVYLQVLLALDRPELSSEVQRCLSRFGDNDRALIEVLGAGPPDPELAPIFGRLLESKPDWADALRTAIENSVKQDAPAQQPFESLLALRTKGPLDVLLPEPPRRTDAAWEERQKAGDAAFLAWLRPWWTLLSIMVGLLLAYLFAG